MARKRVADARDDFLLDYTVDEVARIRRESITQVYKKIRLGVYVSHKNRDTRLITKESVDADRKQALEAGPQLGATNRGRPPKKPQPKTQPSAAE